VAGQAGTLVDAVEQVLTHGRVVGRVGRDLRFVGWVSNPSCEPRARSNLTAFQLSLE